jgi:hypothetical protein
LYDKERTLIDLIVTLSNFKKEDIILQLKTGKLIDLMPDIVEKYGEEGDFNLNLNVPWKDF